MFKNFNRVNFFSLFLIIISGLMWYFLFPVFWSEIKGMDSFVKVEGRSWVKEDIPLDDKLKKNHGDFSNSLFPVSFGSLMKADPKTPIRNQEVGDFYARAHSSIAIDANTGTILHFQDAKQRRAIASLTKLVTALLVIEKIKDLENEIVIIDKEAYSMIGTKVGCPRTGYCPKTRLQIGEQVRAINLLEAMLMNSSNDAAVALAKHISGSIPDFAKEMNEKAHLLGLKDTNFCNPSGLDDSDNPGACYSTAYDYARLTAYALNYDLIWEIMKIKEKKFSSVDGRFVHEITNTDILLDELANCVGGKTGFTYEAGKSLMMVAHHPLSEENRVITVFLNSDYRWEDMRNFFDNWVFNAYNWPN